MFAGYVLHLPLDTFIVLVLDVFAQEAIKEFEFVIMTIIIIIIAMTIICQHKAQGLQSKSGHIRPEYNLIADRAISYVR